MYKAILNLSPPLPASPHLPFSNCFTPDMWASREQLEFLRSKIPGLEEAKRTTGLETYYLSIAAEFLLKWKPEPYHSTDPLSPEELKAATLRKHNRVRNFFQCFNAS